VQVGRQAAALNGAVHVVTVTHPTQYPAERLAVRAESGPACVILEARDSAEPGICGVDERFANGSAVKPRRHGIDETDSARASPLGIGKRLTKQLQPGADPEHDGATRDGSGQRVRVREHACGFDLSDVLSTAQ
jgi:hypothetical protein